MKQLNKAVFIFFFTLFVISCGGSDGSLTSQSGGTTIDSSAAVIEMSSSSDTLQSSANGATTVSIFALVKDSGNAILSGVPVSFSSNSGSIAGIQATTDENGIAIAELTNGSDPTDRTITVTATAGEVSGSRTA